MAKTIRDEDIKLSIIVNGNQAQKEIYKLEQANRKLIESNKDVKKEMLSLTKQGKKKSDEYKNLTKTLNQNNATLELNKLKIRDLEDTIGITNLTLTQLRRRAKEVQVALVNMTPGSAQFKAYNTELAQLNTRISELKGKAVASGMSLGQVADKLNRYQTMIAGIIAVFAGIYLSFQQFVDFQHKLADAQADVMKTTGLTKAEVDELTKSFNSFNTRTPRMELLKLAEEGGRLGIEGSENLQKYVNVANKIKVALGDDLSDTQIREVGKLTEVYKIGAETGRDFDQSMLSLGSAINEVSASGANQAGFLVDYLKRQAGVATQAKIGAANNIGYAATFDELAQSVEVSATAMNKIWMDMFKDSSTYAKIAGVSIKDFNALLQKDSNEAMKAFLRGLNGNNEGLSVMVTKLSDLDVGGVRGAQVIAALAGDVEKLEKKQKIANQALIENVSALNEYNVKNNNVAATLDKIQKKIQGWFNSEKIVSFFSVAINLFADLIGVENEADETTKKWRRSLLELVKILAVIITGLISYKAALLLTAVVTNSYRTAVVLTTLAEKAHALSLSVLNPLINMVKGGLFALRLAWITVTQGTRAATIQMRAFTLATKMNPIGALISLLITAASAWLIFRDRTKEATKVLSEQTIALEVNKNIQEAIAREVAKGAQDMKNKIDPLISIIKDETSSLDLRKRAYNALIKISPDFIDTLDSEYRATDKLARKYDDLILSLESAARARASQKVMQKYYDELAIAQDEQFQKKQIADAEKRENERKKRENEQKSKKAMEAQKYSKNDFTYSHNYNPEKESTKAQEEYATSVNKTREANIKLANAEKYRDSEISRLDAKLKKLAKGTAEYIRTEQELNAWLQKSLENGTPITPISGSSLGLDSDKKKKTGKTNKSDKDLDKLKKENEDLEKEIKNNAKKIYQLVQDNEDAKVSMMKDGYEKDLKELQRTNEKKIQALESQLHSEEKLQAFRNLMITSEDDLKKAEAKKDTKKADLLRERIGLMGSVYQQLLVENKEIQAQLVTSWEIYNTKLSTITEKGINDRITKIHKEFEERQKNDKSNFAFEISQLTTLENAKRKIIELFGEQVSTNELARLKNIHQAKKVLQREFNKKEIEDQKAHLEDLVRELNFMLNSSEWQGMDLTVLTEEQKEDQLKKIEELKQKIAELQSLIGKTGDGKEPTGDGLLSSLGGGKDILGMSPEQWEKLFAQTDNLYDKLAKVIAVAQAMKNAFSSYYEYVNANEQARVQQFENSANQQKSVFKKQLEEGYISQETYDKKVTKLENELAKRKAIAEYRAAKRKKQIDIASAVTNTALAVVNALATSSNFFVGLAMAAVATAMGALQIATISKQPLPDISGYESGFYRTEKMKVRRKEDGKIYHASYGGESRSGLVDNPTVFLAGEGGKNFPEMIIDGRTLTRMRPEVKEAMYQDVARIKGFEKGYYPKTENEDNNNGNDDDISLQMLYELKRQNEYLKLLAEKESIAVLDTSPYQMGKFVDAKKNYDKITNNGKIN